MDLELLKVFKLVAYYNSASKAANELSVTESSVSKNIKKLENILNVTLFVREKRGMKLTEVGKKLYNYVKEPLNILDKAFALTETSIEIDSGTINIGAGFSVSKLMLVDAISDFRHMYPNVNIVLKNQSSSELFNNLKSESLDLIFVNSTLPINTNYYEVIDIIEIEDCFFASRELYEKIKNLENLEKYILSHMIIQNIGFDTRNYFINKCLKNNIQFNPLIQVDRNQLLVDFTLKGLGVGFATKDFIKQYIDEEKIVILDTKFKFDKRKIVAVYKKNSNIKSKINFILKLINYNIKK